MGKSLISGIMQRVNLEALMVLSIGEAGASGQMFRKLAENRINLEFISRVPHKNGNSSVVICVDSKDASAAIAVLEEVKPVLKALDILPLARAGILSIFPHREHAVIISIIIQTLSTAKIPLFAMGSSISAISCVIAEGKMAEALKLLSRQFGLS